MNFRNPETASQNLDIGKIQRRRRKFNPRQPFILTPNIWHSNQVVDTEVDNLLNFEISSAISLDIGDMGIVYGLDYDPSTSYIDTTAPGGGGGGLVSDLSWGLPWNACDR